MGNNTSLSLSGSTIFKPATANEVVVAHPRSLTTSSATGNPPILTTGVNNKPTTHSTMVIPKSNQMTAAQRGTVSAPSSPYSNHNTTIVLSSKPRSADSDSPFAVACPYNGCVRKVEAKDFYGHVIKNHKTAPQNYSCPICPLLGFASYKANQNTNLMNHLQKHHPDLTYSKEQSVDEIVSEFDPSLMADGQDVPQDITFDTAKIDIGSKYVEEVLMAIRTGECEICFEDYKIGDTVARLDCFCVYHKKCIDQWFARGHQCPIHKRD